MQKVNWEGVAWAAIAVGVAIFIGTGMCWGPPSVEVVKECPKETVIEASRRPPVKLETGGGGK